MLTLCAAAILVVPALSRAQDQSTASAAPATPAATTNLPAKKRAAPATLPFRGTVTALDTNAMTLTVGQRTFNVTSETKITRDDKPTVLASGTVGEPVRGACKKTAEGKLDATTIRFGEAKPSPKKESTGN